MSGVWVRVSVGGQSEIPFLSTKLRVKVGAREVAVAVAVEVEG